MSLNIDESKSDLSEQDTLSISSNESLYISSDNEYISDDNDLYLDEQISSLLDNREFLTRKSNLKIKYPEQIIWLNLIFKWLEKPKEDWIITLNDDTLEVEFILLNDGDIKLHFKWLVESTHPLFPHTPPQMKLISTNLELIDILSLSYMESFDRRYWNICQNLDNLLDMIKEYMKNKNILNEDDYSEILVKHLIQLSTISEIYPTYIKSDLPKFGVLKDESNYKTHNNGIGYSIGCKIEDWDTNKWNESQQRTTILLNDLLSHINQIKLTDIDMKNIYDSSLIIYLEELITNCSIQDIYKNKELYHLIYKYGEFFYQHNGYIEIHNILTKKMKNIKDIAIKSNTLGTYEKELLSITDKFLKQNNQFTDKTEDRSELTEIDIFKNELKNEQCVLLDEEFEHHSFKKEKFQYLNCNYIKRAYTEWVDFENCIPFDLDSSIFIRWTGDTDENYLYKILICPSLSTPYGGGCFEFDLFLPDDYPKSSPKMKFLTTGSGAVRFNPNLYNCGKICLSLLGTWSGEKWNPSVSNLYQLFVSILGLIFVEDPYYNEPGYQSEKGTEKGLEKSNKYNDNIRYYTVKYAIYERLIDQNTIFKEVINKYYKLRWKTIKLTIDKWILESHLYKDKLENYKNKIDLIINNQTL